MNIEKIPDDFLESFLLVTDRLVGSQGAIL